MIALLSGEVAEKLSDMIVVDVHGVGYGVYVSAEDYGRLAVGAHAKLHIYEHIREAQHDLFGFVTRDTKQLFEQLLGVNGVGPKMALNILSIGSASEVRGAIARADTKLLVQANGVGKRVAERVVVELKNKVGLDGVDLESTGLLQSDATLLQDEAAQGLVALGFSAVDAAKALQTVDAGLSTEERIKQALKSKF